MKQSIKKGFSFGLTSGIITTLGLIVGLNSSTHSLLVVIGGIVIIAIADALSDSLGIHMSEEADGKSKKEIWGATFSTFFFKFIFASMFIVPFLMLGLTEAVWVSVVFGLSLISVFSYYLAKMQKVEPYKIVFEHLGITLFVIFVTYYVGVLVGKVFV